ncbi:MAG: cell wall metabolism sensor histidine kinase WalK [candidate division KSB1 bacterium]|nr:cell wall metabolism sensor histidine kinase WalK [candidate division KSB1 bacterium]
MRHEVAGSSVFRRIFAWVLLGALVPLSLLALYASRRGNMAGWELWPFYLGATLTAAVIAFLVARSLVVPLKELERGAREIARGQFQHRIPVRSDDEFGKLARLFNYMTTELQRLNDLNISRIITERNKNEAMLRHLADGVIVTDLHGNIMAIGAELERRLGVRAEEVRGKPLAELWNNRRLLRLIQRVARAPKVRSLSTEIVDRCGQEWGLRTFECKAAPVLTAENEKIGVVTIVRDVTREREADRLKTELVSMVAHELRSPLTSIRGFSELLLHADADREQIQQYAAVIHEETVRLTELVNKFLDISRLESGRLEPRWEPVDLAEVVTTVLANHSTLAEAKEIQVHWEHRDNLPRIEGDKQMLTQVVLNLYSNAVKYSPPGRQIWLDVRRQGREMVLTVQDEGVGIPKKDLPHIFRKFYRGSNVSLAEDGSQGSGLGLALVARIVELHRGRILVRSSEGKGTIFRIYFPLERTGDGEEVAPSLSSSESSNGG